MSISEDAIAILRATIPNWDSETYGLYRAQLRPNDEKGRYVAVQVAGYGTYLIDRQEEKATKAGEGTFLGWTQDGNLLIWNSTEGQSPEIAIMD